jgi:hypothetical protein
MGMDRSDMEEKDPAFGEALARALAEEGAPLDKDELRDLILDPTEEEAKPLRGMLDSGYAIEWSRPCPRLAKGHQGLPLNTLTSPSSTFGASKRRGSSPGMTQSLL